MKKIIILIGLVSGSVLAQASEVRNLSAVCTSKDQNITVKAFAHDDAITSGLVDFLVEYKFPSSVYSYMINDVKGGLTAHQDQVSFVYSDGDITFDLLVDNVKDSAHLLMDEKGNRLDLVCKQAE